MDAHEKVGLHTPRLLHARAKRHEKVGIARQKGAHRIAVHAAGVNAVAQLEGDLQHDVFFASSGRSGGAWIFAAVAGVQGHDDEAVGAVGRGSAAARDHRWRRCRSLFERDGADQWRQCGR